MQKGKGKGPPASNSPGRPCLGGRLPSAHALREPTLLGAPIDQPCVQVGHVHFQGLRQLLLLVRQGQPAFVEGFFELLLLPRLQQTVRPEALPSRLARLALRRLLRRGRTTGTRVRRVLPGRRVRWGRGAPAKKAPERKPRKTRRQGL